MLRGEQKELIGGARDKKELIQKIKDINFIEEEIKNVKENKPVKIRLEKFKKTTRGRLISLRDWARKNKTTLGAGIVGLIVSVTSSIMSTIPLVDRIKDGIKQIGKLGNSLENAGRKLKQISKKLDEFTKKPVETLALLLNSLGYLTKEATQYPTIIISILVSLIIAYIIKWRGG